MVFFSNTSLKLDISLFFLICIPLLLPCECIYISVVYVAVSLSF